MSCRQLFVSSRMVGHNGSVVCHTPFKGPCPTVNSICAIEKCCNSNQTVSRWQDRRGPERGRSGRGQGTRQRHPGMQGRWNSQAQNRMGKQISRLLFPPSGQLFPILKAINCPLLHRISSMAKKRCIFPEKNRSA